MSEITLKCCTCGTEKTVFANPPTFGFEFYEIAKNAGFYPIIDLNFGRTLCFCDEDCMKKQLTKKGYIRKRLIHAEKGVID